jgi:hypothetical protein
MPNLYPAEKVVKFQRRSCASLASTAYITPRLGPPRQGLNQPRLTLLYIILLLLLFFIRAYLANRFSFSQCHHSQPTALQKKCHHKNIGDVHLIYDYHMIRMEIPRNGDTKCIPPVSPLSHLSLRVIT